MRLSQLASPHRFDDFRASRAKKFLNWISRPSSMQWLLLLSFCFPLHNDELCLSVCIITVMKWNKWPTSGAAVCPGEKRRERWSARFNSVRRPATHTHTLARGIYTELLPLLLLLLLLLWSMERFTPSHDALCIYNTDSWFHSFKKSPKP